MKTRIKIRKSAVAAPVDFGRALDLHEVNGVKLKYTEYDFLILDGGAVFFDAYSSTHTYKPLPVECGAIAFPFTCECMTDVGERIAYAGLRFSEQQPVRWELLGKDEVLGLLPVDNDAAAVPITSGVCCFADENAYRLYTSHLKDEIHPLAGMIVLNGQTHATVELYGKKFAVFSTGWGDGRYKRYCGYDEAGAACRVLCDFGMIEYERDDTLVEIEAETGDSGQYVYDPAKSDSENNIAQWTHALRGATTADDRLHAFIRRGYAYHLAGDPALALGDYLSAISCSKSARLCGDAAQYRVWSAYEGAASLYCERSDYDSAIALMTDYISAQGDAYGDAYVKLIDLYQVTKRTDLALKTAESLIKLRPDDPVPLVKYAECADRKSVV